MQKKSDAKRYRYNDFNSAESSLLNGKKMMLALRLQGVNSRRTSHSMRHQHGNGHGLQDRT